MTGHHREDFVNNENSLAGVQAEKANLAAQIAELTTQMEGLTAKEAELQGAPNEMLGAAQEEANVDNEQFDAEREATRIAEEQAAEKAKQSRLAELRTSIQSGSGNESVTPEGDQEKPKIDPIEINNRIIRIEKGSKKLEALDALTPEEIDAIAEMIGKQKTPDDIMRNLSVFGVEKITFTEDYKVLDRSRGIKPEIAGHPVVAEALKRLIQSNAWVHLYDIQDIMHNIPDSEKIFEDEKVREKLVQSAISEMQDRDPGARKNFLKIIGEIQFTKQELRDIADGLKMNNDRLAEFVNHFGAKTIYPEMQ